MQRIVRYSDKYSAGHWSEQITPTNAGSCADLSTRKDFEAAIVRQQREIEALAAGLQKVSAQLELSKPAAQTVLNKQ